MDQVKVNEISSSLKSSYKTGLAQKFNDSTPTRRIRTKLYFPRVGAIVIIVISCIVVRMIYMNGINGQAESTEAFKSFENPQMPYDFLEVTNVNIQDGESSSSIEYEIINHGDQTITFGYGPDLRPNDSIIVLNEDAIQFFMADGSITKSFGGHTLEPKEKKQISLTIKEPLENLIKIETVIKNETTGETVKWQLVK